MSIYKYKELSRLKHHVTESQQTGWSIASIDVDTEAKHMTKSAEKMFVRCIFVCHFGKKFSYLRF